MHVRQRIGSMISNLYGPHAYYKKVDGAGWVLYREDDAAPVFLGGSLNDAADNLQIQYMIKNKGKG